MPPFLCTAQHCPGGLKLSATQTRTRQSKVETFCPKGCGSFSGDLRAHPKLYKRKTVNRFLYTKISLPDTIFVVCGFALYSSYFYSDELDI